MFEVDFLDASVAGAAHAGDGDGLVDGGLDTAPDGVSVAPGGGGLFDAGRVEGFLDRSWMQGEVAAAALAAGA
nr:hypothetical protein [Nonomuraea sediminis]